MKFLFWFLLMVFEPSLVFPEPKPKSSYLLIKLPDSSLELHHGNWKPLRGGKGGKVWMYVQREAVVQCKGSKPFSSTVPKNWKVCPPPPFTHTQTLCHPSGLIHSYLIKSAPQSQIKFKNYLPAVSCVPIANLSYVPLGVREPLV